MADFFDDVAAEAFFFLLRSFGSVGFVLSVVPCAAVVLDGAPCGGTPVRIFPW